MNTITRTTPTTTVIADVDINDDYEIVLTGPDHNYRIHLTPNEARTLATALTNTATTLDQHIAERDGTDL